MHNFKIGLVGLCCQLLAIHNIAAKQPEKHDFEFKSFDHGQKTVTSIRLNEQQQLSRYEANLNMPVCDDNLCANVVVKMYWDLAGNYSGFDTLAGKPLTKFDHRPFSSADYLKLDEILGDKNSILRVLGKDELTDKSVKLKSSTVDAVTGATPASVKEQVVEGAVYSAFTLWHFVNGPIKDSIQHFTKSIFTYKLAKQMLYATNHETQLFALKQLPDSFYEANALLIFDIMRKSSPLVRAFIVSKMPLPFSNPENNKAFAALYVELDNYSKSMFRQRIDNSKALTEMFGTLIK
ncbi:MAG: hypothetical protein AUK44_02710 [Porphyromonadaceae bacterium CG2_30_38_12]|nr:MAG: hypothetical protein AUK44_02710 [Porphyromonadaceae bacterium CG2_30_38_12]